MRFTISPEQQKFFHFHHYLEIEEILSDEESQALLKAIKNIHIKSPGYPEENLFRSIPLITTLTKKKGWGQLASELLHKKPLRLAYDKFSNTLSDCHEIISDDACGLLLELKSRRGFFFKIFPDSKHFSLANDSEYFMLVLTAKYLPEQIHPIIICSNY